MTWTQRLAAPGLLTLSLAALLAHEHSRAQLDATASFADPLPIAAPAALSHDAPGERSGQWLTAALARPLFEPTRRPPQPDPASVALPALVPRLSGVVVSTSDRLAIFVDQFGKLSIVREGQQILPYRVTRITPDQVAVLGPDGRHVLRPVFAARKPSIAAGDAAKPHVASGPMSILQRLRSARHQDVALPGPVSLQTLMRRLHR